MRYVGEPVAIVVAQTLAEAMDAAERVEVVYEPVAAVARSRDAMLPGADGARLWQAVCFLRERLMPATAQLVPVVHRRDPRARVATATSLAARHAEGPCGPAGASVSATRSRRCRQPTSGSAR